MTPLSAPRISVIVPCYNKDTYLDEALQSILNQTYHDVEIIIIDGSTDPATHQLLADYRGPKIRIVESENRGLAAARNEAVRHAIGRYIFALDADDKLASTFLEKAAHILDKDDSVAFVSCFFQTFGQEDGVWSQNGFDLPILLGEWTIAMPLLIRRDAVLDAGGYDEHMSSGYADWDLCVSLVERKFRGVV